MRQPLEAVAVPVVSAAIALAGCGGGGSSDGVRQQVATAVQRFEVAAQNRDGNTYCASLTTAERAAVLQKLPTTAGLRGPCASVMHATLYLFTTNRTAANANVSASNVVVHGNRATVVLPGDRKRIQLQDVGGTWQVSALPNDDFAG
jgi:hypothetical protein